jgi:hypothetical protein
MKSPNMCVRHSITTLYEKLNVTNIVLYLIYHSKIKMEDIEFETHPAVTIPNLLYPEPLATPAHIKFLINFC